ncbi:MAG TPA: copper homeostasis protein CutC [Saprospiraceae bacterium]|nr:copper homeostasis protein CutC [Saprospiraceae bacterium]
MTIILEACVDSVESAASAEAHGAHRLELCANLHLDGTTPDSDLIRLVISSVQIPVKVMIRPRGGDFVYSEAEFKEMLDAIEVCKTLGVPEIVSGILRKDNTLDVDRLKILAQTAHPLPVTIHKCIDLVPDVFEAIEELKQIHGVRSILSSGQASTASQGAGMLKKMLLACGERLTLIVAGKVTQQILPELIVTLDATEYHGRQII